MELLFTPNNSKRYSAHCQHLEIFKKYMINISKLIFYLSFILVSDAVSAQEKVYLTCYGKSWASSSNDISSYREFTKTKPITIDIKIDESEVVVNGYVFKQRQLTFPEYNSENMYEDGKLMVNDLSYYGIFLMEKNKNLRLSKNSDDNKLYKYELGEISLDRVNGIIRFTLEIYGSSWVSKLLNKKPINQYVKLIFEGECAKRPIKTQF